MTDWTALGVAVHGVGSRESGDFASRWASGRSEGARAATEPAGTTRSGRPARRRPSRRHGATTRSLGPANRLPDGKSLTTLSRRPITAWRQVHSAASKNEAV